MAYFLKKTNTKKGTYLQIYSSYYDPERGGTAHKSHKVIGYVHELEKKGIKDPIAFYKKEVEKLNKKYPHVGRVNNTGARITEEILEKNIGYFLHKNVHDELGVRKNLEHMQTGTGFRFNLYELLSAFVYSNAMQLRSKAIKYDVILPTLFDKCDFNPYQITEGLRFLSNEYENIMRMYGKQVHTQHTLKTKRTYFDFSNYYFNLDKVHRVTIGLLTDDNQIPIDMKLFIGTSRSPIVERKVSDRIKDQNYINGSTVHIIKKTRNLDYSIFKILKNDDDYMYSIKLNHFSKEDKEWALDPDGYKEVKASSGAFLCFAKEHIADYKYTIKGTKTKKTRTFTIQEKRMVVYCPKGASKIREPFEHFMIVTSDYTLSNAALYSAYTNLIEMEKTFEVIQDWLADDPTYLKDEEMLPGFMLIGYISILLTRLLKEKRLRRHYPYDAFLSFVRDFKIAKISERKYLNLTQKTSFLSELADYLDLPLESLFLTSADVKRILNHKF